MTLNWIGSVPPPVPYSALSTKTGADGTYAISVPAGTYFVSFVPARTSGLYLGWYGSTDPFALTGMTLTVNRDFSGIDGSLIPGYLVTGKVTDAATGQITTCPVHSVQPGRSNVGAQSSLTWGPLDRNGMYAVWVPAGTYQIIVVIFDTCQSATKTVVVNSNLSGVDFALVRK